MDPLQKLLAMLGIQGAPQTTPPFNPNAAAYTPAAPVQPVPIPSQQPRTAPNVVSGGVAPRPGYDSEGIAAGMPNMAPHVNSRREQLEGDYADIAAAPADKQNKWLQGLFLAMQAGQRIADPMNQAGAYDSKQPIQWLGNAKKAGELSQIQSELAPIYAQDQQRAGGLKTTIDLESELAKIGKTKAETQQILKGGGKAPERITSEGIVYERQQDGSWATAQGIPAPTRVSVTLKDGTKVALTPEEAFRQERSDARNTETANATRESKQIERDIDATRYQKDDEAKIANEQNEFQNKRAALITEGEELQNEAAILEGQAADLAAAGGVAEAAKLREKAAEKRTQGRAKINTGNRMQAPRSRPKSYTPPKERARIDKKRDPYGLLQ